MPVDGFDTALNRLGPFGARPRLAVAVSGGADSTALALLTQKFCKANGGEARAFIVDHGLREGSAEEAALTARRVGERGIAARIVTLSGLPRGAGLQEAARQARYEALAAACAEDGFLHLLLGHHRADQEETVAMRAARGPGGAEGIAAWSARNKILLLRPLLGVRPEILRDYLRSEDMAWVEDPSNISPRFERVRLRQSGTNAAPAGAEERAARDEAVAAYLAAHAQIRPEGFALLDAGSAPHAVLGALIRMIAGADYMPRQEPLARLGAKLRPATLGGVRLLSAGKLGSVWLLAREPAACAPPITAAPGVRWDGRFVLEAVPSPGMILGALGADAAKCRKFSPLPGIVLRGLPALRGMDGVLIFPAPVRFVPPVPATSHPFRV
ncbi:MAG TPA: tRNA lysidine(34) synthetase TilS [Acidocella sp.]|nr:tRNA lysidine(34) synthetase TilS [Acidocella sp.]